jgi:hypothetical protein
MAAFLNIETVRQTEVVRQTSTSVNLARSDNITHRSSFANKRLVTVIPTSARSAAISSSIKAAVFVDEKKNGCGGMK